MGEVTCNDVKRVLQAAKQKIQTSGWTQGAYMSAFSGTRCAAGAIYFAAAGSRVTGPAADAFTAAIGRSSVVAWNDDPERTKDDVLKAFQAAIDLVS